MFCLSANTFSINLMKKNIGLTKWILIVTKLFWGSVKNRSNTRCPYAYTTTRTRSSMKSASFRLKITPLMFYDCYIYVSRWLINWFGKIYFFTYVLWSTKYYLYRRFYNFVCTMTFKKKLLVYLYFFYYIWNHYFFGGRGVL